MQNTNSPSHKTNPGLSVPVDASIVGVDNPSERKSVRLSRSPQTDISVDGLIPVKFVHDPARNGILECRGDRQLLMEGELLGRRITDGTHPAVLIMLAAIKDGRQKVDPRMREHASDVEILAVAERCVAASARRIMSPEVVVGFMRCAVMGSGKLVPQMLRVLADARSKSLCILSHLRQYSRDRKVEPFVPKVVDESTTILAEHVDAPVSYPQEQLPTTLVERVALYVKGVNLMDREAVYERMSSKLRNFGCVQIVTDLRHAAIWCARSGCFDWLFEKHDSGVVLDFAFALEKVVGEMKLPMGTWKVFDTVSGNLDTIPECDVKVRDRVRRAMGTVGFFNETIHKQRLVMRTNRTIMDPNKEGNFNVRFDMIKVDPTDEVWRRVILGAKPSYVTERVDHRALWLRKVARADPNSVLSSGYASMVRKVVVRCERPDGRTFQGVVIGGYVVTFDMELERRVLWTGSGEGYAEPVWDGGDVRIYAGNVPDSVMSLTYDHVGTWHGDDVSVIWCDGGNFVSAAKKVYRREGNLGYLRLCLPPLALGAVCVTVSTHRVVAYVCAIGKQWCRIRFIGSRIAMVFPDFEFAMIEKPAGCGRIVRSTSSRWGTYYE